MTPVLRNDLNGIRIKLPGTGPVYLIDMGKKRLIPNVKVYDRIFADWNNIYCDININDIITGDPIPEYAEILKEISEGKLFLLDGKKFNYKNVRNILSGSRDSFEGYRNEALRAEATRRPIRGKAVFDHYNFNENKIENYNIREPDSFEWLWEYWYPIGPMIANPPNAVPT